MDIMEVLAYIAEASKDDTKMILDAAIRRSEEYLCGGEILCAVFSRKQVERRNEIMRRMKKYEEMMMEEDA